MLPVVEAIIAGLIVGAVNRMLARLENECPEARMRRDDSSASTASSETLEISHFH
jgi:hypothetical protein